MSDFVYTECQKITLRWSWNITRVQNLYTLYGTVPESRLDDADVREDILRAAVVTLHATLEDLIRQTLVWKLPEVAPDKWDKLECGTLKIPVKEFIGKNVTDVVREVVRKHLDQTSFNNPTEIMAAIKPLDIDTSKLTPFLDDIGKMVARRHKIVHNSDRTTEQLQSGHGAATPISEKTLLIWLIAVQKFGLAFLEIISDGSERIPPKGYSVQ